MGIFNMVTIEGKIALKASNQMYACVQPNRTVITDNGNKIGPSLEFECGIVHAGRFALESASFSQTSDEIIDVTIQQPELDQAIKESLKLEDLSDVLVKNPTNGSVDISRTISEERTFSDTVSWDTEWGTQLTTSYDMSVSIASIVDMSLGLSLTVSTKISSAASITRKVTRRLGNKFDYMCPPMRQCRIRVQVYKAVLKVPFTATIRRYGDRTFTFTEHGQWE